MAIQNYLSALPLEILDSIISDLDEHFDLISLSLACKDISRVVIPRHSEYRVLRTRHRFPGLWAHLAKRADLSRNLREIHVSSQKSSDPERYPLGLVASTLNGTVDVLKEEEERVRNVLTVMGYTQRLEVFQWDFRYCSTMNADQEIQLISILSRTPSISQLVLVGELRCLAPRSDNHSGFQLAWNMPNLHELALMGNVWSSPITALSLKHVLKQSIQLKRLQIPIEAISICDFIIPTLRQLSLYLQSGTTIRVIKQWDTFLENHPLLEDLWCNPSSTMVLPRNGLVKLRRLSVERNFIDSFRDAEQVPENLECLQYSSFQFRDGVLPKCNFKNLRKLYLFSVEGESELNSITTSCPALKWLHIVQCIKFELNVWLDFLSSFPDLEVLRGPAIWISVDDDNDKMHMAIMELVQRCPNLQELDHRNVRGRSRKVIVIIKEQTKDGLHVRYEVQRSQSRGQVYLMDDTFT